MSKVLVEKSAILFVTTQFYYRDTEKIRDIENIL